jgi:hypothetical protein
MGRAGHTTPLCGSHPFQRHQPADVVGKVLQADFGFARAMPIVRTTRPNEAARRGVEAPRRTMTTQTLQRAADQPATIGAPARRPISDVNRIGVRRMMGAGSSRSNTSITLQAQSPVSPLDLPGLRGPSGCEPLRKAFCVSPRR